MFERILNSFLIAIILSTQVVIHAQDSPDINFYYGFRDQSGSTQDSKHYTDRRNTNIRQGLDNIWGNYGTGETVGGAISKGSIPLRTKSISVIKREQTRQNNLNKRIENIKNSSRTLNPLVIYNRYIEQKEIEGLSKYQSTKDPDDLYVKWQTTNKHVLSLLAESYYELQTYESTNLINGELQNIGLNAIELADRAYADSEIEDAQFYFNVGKGIADLLIGINPITGTLVATYEAITGESITGEPLSTFDRGIAVFGVVSLGYGRNIGKGIRALDTILSNSKFGQSTWAASKRIVNQIHNVFNRFANKNVYKDNKVATYIGILREAAEGPRKRIELGLNNRAYLGTLGTASSAEAEMLGKAWTGINPTSSSYRRFPSKKIFHSTDNKTLRRTYRPPVLKSNGKLQSNFEYYQIDADGTSTLLSNMHLDIVD